MSKGTLEKSTFLAESGSWFCVTLSLRVQSSSVVLFPKHWRVAKVEKGVLLQPPLSVDLPWPMFGPGASLKMLSLSERAGNLCSHIWPPTFLSFSRPLAIISKRLLDIQHKSQ